MEQPLHLYQASAGSGKTFNIARQFLRLCLRNPESRHYRRILAITFTNKATGEMKSRFLKELRVLAHGHPSAHLEYLTKGLNLEEETIRFRARQVLRQILHDYHHLSVMTIDAFFQRILRAFAQDMRLSGSFETELQQSVVTDFAVQELLNRSTQESHVFERLVQLLLARMEEGASWNFHDSLKRFASELMREEVDLIQRPADFEDKIEQIQQQAERIKLQELEDLKPHAELVQQLWEVYRLEDVDFHGKSKGIRPFLEDIVAGRLPAQVNKPTVTLLSDLNEGSVWIKPKSLGYNQVQDALNAGFGSACQAILVIQQAYAKLKNTFSILLGNTLVLKFLPLLSEALQAFPAKTGLLPQGDVSRLINQLIKNNDSSFLLERAGTQFRHYLLDEFQDTSRLQWENLKPLLTESIASGHFCMAVGDVKQAIYRWRNGDWRLLGGELAHYYEGQVRQASLQVNFRSSAAIIHFNNWLFPLLANSFYQELKDLEIEVPLPEEAARAFQHFYSPELMNQLLPEKKKLEASGWVSMTLAEKEHAAPLDWMLNQVEKALSYGFKAGDIAILARKNSQATQIALHLLQHQLDEAGNTRWAVLTEEALRLGQSQEVRAIMAVCTMMYANQMGIANDIAVLTLASCLTDPEAPWEAPLSLNFDELQSKFPAWQNLLIPELIATIIEELQLHQRKGARPYLLMLEEELNVWSSTQQGDLKNLLEWWEETGIQTKVLTATAANAIRVMTIHQSKGLEFPVVLLPFLEEKIDDNSGFKGTNLWEDVSTLTQIDTGTLPIKYGQSLVNSAFHPLYLREKTMRYMDLLNLVYVAFTRPCDWLCGYAVMPPKTQSGERNKGNWVNLLELLLPKAEHMMHHDALAGSVTYSMGQPSGPSETHEPTTSTLDLSHYSLFPIPNFFPINQKESKSGNRGRLLHAFLASLTNTSEAITKLEEWFQFVELDEEEKNDLKHQLQQLMNIPEFHSLFSTDAEILTERDFLSPEGILRPDRVVIWSDKAIVADFKTGVARAEHEQQIRRYAQYLSQMLHVPVQGLLLYTSNSTTITI